jgi:hypothetical protein
MLPDRTRDTEWTPGIGLRRAALTLLLKSPLCLVGWVVFLLITEPAAAWLVTNSPIRGAPLLAAVVAIVVAVIAWPTGHLLSRRLTEQTGFEGPAPAALGIVTVWVVVLLGTRLAGMIGGPATWITTVATVGMGLEASLVVLWRTWVDPD